MPHGDDVLWHLTYKDARARCLANHRLTSGTDQKRGTSAFADQAFEVGLRSTNFGCGTGVWTVELPSDQKPVGLFPCVEAIRHRAVEVDQVLARPGSELGQVEIGVAANQGIGRPLDGRDSALEAPAALILL